MGKAASSDFWILYKKTESLRPDYMDWRGGTASFEMGLTASQE